MKTRPPPRSIRPGVEVMGPGRGMPRHQHGEAYATLILDGRYEQTAYAGRIVAEPGCVLLQPTLDCHANRMLGAGATIVRLAWRREGSLGGLFRIAGFDDIRRAAERDPTEASAGLAEAMVDAEAAGVAVQDWQDELVGALHADPRLRISQWSERMGLARETVSRGFGRAYGVGPARFRAELQARGAFLRITGGEDPLAQIASELGFADQPHMTRAVGWLTGAPPAAWRARSHRFKTRAAA
jgi:AraC-like DNA-binding protein